SSHHNQHSHAHSYTLYLHDALPILKLGFDLQKLHDLVYVEVSSEEQFFHSNADAFSTHFNELETQKIKIYVQDMSANFNIQALLDRKSTRLNSSHVKISYAVFCLNK